MDADASSAAMDVLQPLSPSLTDVKPSVEHQSSSTKPANALTPPTSEEMNHEIKIENEESELSDLDVSDDDEEEIVPDHYWDGGKIPVFKPTMDQFRSFKKYVRKIDKYGMKSGIVKVIPPKEWRDSLPALDDMVKRIKIKNPITQEFVGTFGTYTQQNVEKQRSYNLPEWKALTEETHHQPPARRGERRRNQEKVVRGAASTTRSRATKDTADASPQPKKKPGRARRGPPPEVEEDDDAEAKASPAPKAKAAPKKRGKASGQGQTRSVTSRRLNNTAEAADWIDEKAFKNFDYHMDGLDEFSAERCAELETHYWKSLGFNAPMYAADMPGSLFDDSVTSWNVAKLENLLDVLGTKVPGVNTAYLYLGMWKATFAWHLEDVDLYSINYIHFGAPKQWYSISQEDARRFEAAMRNNWTHDAKMCDQFLRHKTYLISPDVLQKQYNVKVNKLVHYEGEFVITYPYGYHSGYNLGYNCAESVNFATESWLEYGRIARKCNCEADNVWVDVAEIERKLRGEPTPEFYEETDDDDDDMDDDSKLPTPPASVRGQKTGSRKRKRDDKKDVKKKKKIRIRIRPSAHEPCAMCPNDQAWEPLLPTDNDKHAHRVCALYTPETFISVIDGVETICGIGNIDKARLELKCNYCRSKRGAVFQCYAKKCTRAFHATCAFAAGVQVDLGPVPTFGEDGTEYYEDGHDLRCRFHRPKMPKNATVEMLENTKRVMTQAKDIQPNEIVQAQLIGGDVFAGRVIENRPGEQSLLVEVLNDGDQIELEWKYLAIPNPDDSQRIKPSPHAIPLPAGMNKQSVSVDNRQDGVPTPDELFLPDSTYKWAEFNNTYMSPQQHYVANHYKAVRTRVDLDKPEQTFYYLPGLSTDAKSCWTDQVGGTDHNPRSQPSLPEPKPRPVPAPAININVAVPVDDKIMRPYVYKPRKKAATQIAVDHQALANQRNFTAQAGRQGFTTGQIERNNAIRAFPTEQYYSHRVLPAAFPGDYSGFTREVRRQSQGAQHLQRPDFPAMRPQTGITHYAPVANMTGMQPSVFTNTASSPDGSRPSSAQHPSSALPPLTPLTSVSSLSKPQTRPQTSHDGATSEVERISGQATPATAMSNEQWTPPSQRPGANREYTPPVSDDKREVQQAVNARAMDEMMSEHAALREYGPPTYEHRWGHPNSSVSPWSNTPITPSQPPSYGDVNPGSHAGAQFVNHNYETFQGQNTAAMRMGTGLDLGPMLPRMESPGMSSDTWK